MNNFLNFEIDFSARDPLPSTDQLFYERWSPRSFDQKNIPDELIKSVIDAAHWSQSAFNEQPWRFLTSTTDTFDHFLDLLVDRNQIWAKNASLLGFIIARKNFTHNEKANRWANFDCGAAWMGLTLQARKFGLYTHGMAGIKQDEVYDFFAIDRDQYRVICAFALGYLGSPEKLPEDFQKMEKPSSRKSLEEVWQIGKWQN
jgi:nitroreductase